jgi:hypothetical protein
MRKAVLTMPVVALTLLGPVGGGAAAGAPGQTTCRFAFDNTLSPGLSAAPGSGTFSSGGETGTVDCTGPVDGLSPTGTGSFGDSGRYGSPQPNSCASAVTGDGDGSGVVTMTVPTTGGPRTVVDNFTLAFGGRVPTHGGMIAGTFAGDHLSGTFEISPRDGYCVSPVTRVHITGEGVLH